MASNMIIVIITGVLKAIAFFLRTKSGFLRNVIILNKRFSWNTCCALLNFIRKVNFNLRFQIDVINRLGEIWKKSSDHVL